ncbi:MULTISPECIES: VanZ family protein [unclassified Streptomyces]|uniref:VanZ family protein n=1 Tax=unclassified Streptomyces TaxID=2593676 RepID=UPI00380DD99F
MWQLILYVTPVNVIIGLLVCLLLCMLGLRFEAKGDSFQLGARVLLLFFVAITLLATITPDQAIGSGDNTIWAIPGRGIFLDYSTMGSLERSMYVREQVANAAMFIPIAISCRFAHSRFSGMGVISASCALSIAIEFTQWLMKAGRVVDIDDVIVNTCGAAIGVLLYALADRLVSSKLKHRSHRRSRLSSFDRG